MTQDIHYHKGNLHLTFSQRVGAVPLPDPIKLKQLPKPFRIALAYLFREEIEKVTRRTDGDYYHTDKTHVGISLWHYKMKVLNKFPHDIPNPIPERDYGFIASLLENGQYHEILTLCEWFLRNASHLQELCNGIVSVFYNNPSAYKIGYAGYEPFIYPVNQASAETIAEAIAHLNSTSQNSVLTHIRESATKFNNEDYAGSVKSSIDAVESIARQLAPNSNALGKALHEINNQNLIPDPALTEIIQIIHQMSRYANQQEGVRHALVTEDEPSVEPDEALYIFGLCAVTADYLASKQRPN